MAVAPILTIPVDDSEFEKFKAAFADYHEKLKSTPAEWEAVNQRVIELGKLHRKFGTTLNRTWTGATAEVKGYERSVETAVKAQESLGRSSRAAAAAVHKMSIDAKSMATHVAHTISSLARFGIFSFGAGLVGFGGLTFGLDRLAGSVLSQSKEARSLGITPGQLNSFRVNMTRVAGVGILRGAAEAQIDLSKIPALAMLGISSQRAHSESATDLAFDEIMAVHRAFRRNPAMFEQTAAGLASRDLGISPLEAQLIGRTPTSTLEADRARVLRDAGALGFSPKVAREWSNFDIQLHKAGVLIETALINTLAPLAGPLTLLSKRIADLITGLEESGQLKAWIDDLSAGIKNFATWLGSPSFHQDVATFATDFHIVAQAVLRVARDIGGIATGKTFKATESGQALFDRDKNVPGTEAYKMEHEGYSPGWALTTKYGRVWVGKPYPGMNNPLNMKNTRGEFMGFETIDAGVRAADKRLLTEPIYSGRSLAEQIAIWNGHGSNTAEYQRRVAQWAGQDLGLGHPLGEDVPFSDYSPRQQAAIISAMSREEGHPVSFKQVLADMQSGQPIEVARRAGAPGGQSPAQAAAAIASSRSSHPTPESMIRHAARVQTARYLGLPAPHGPGASLVGATAPLPGRVYQTGLTPLAAPVPGVAAMSDIATVRSRFWQTQHGLNVRVHNQAGANVSVSSTAAAAQ